MYPPQLLSRRRFLKATGGLMAAGAVPATPGLARSASPSLMGLRRAVDQSLYTPRNPAFTAASRVYNKRFDSITPFAVARPRDSAAVQRAVRWGVSDGVRLRARSGGHSYAGYSTLADGVVIDMRDLRHVHVDRRTGTATVGAGTQLIDLYTALAAAGATVPAGSCPSVGISGVALGGGMGLAGRAWGLTTDHIVGAEIVTADGRLRRLTARTDPDLLWALRGGGGGNFGIVTEFTLKLQPLPPAATAFFVTWPWSAAAEALHTWMRWAPYADSRLTSIFKLDISGAEPTVMLSGQFLGSSADAEALIRPMAQLPGAVPRFETLGYLPLQLLWAGCAYTSEAACHTVGTAPGGTLSRSFFFAKSDYMRDPISEQAAATLVSVVATRAGKSGSGAVLFDSYGGAINRVAPDATAFVHRDQLCAIQYLSYGGDHAWVQKAWASMRPYVSGQAYQNYIDAGLSDWRSAYYAGNYKRLVSTRQEYDPHHFFRFRQGIGA